MVARCLVDEPGFLPNAIQPQVGQRVPGPESLTVGKEEDGRAASGERFVCHEEVPHPLRARGQQKHPEVPDAEAGGVEGVVPGSESKNPRLEARKGR